MGLKKPITSTLKPVSGMCWTQPAQQGVQYRPPYPIYKHLSFCVPEKPFLLREESSKRGTAQRHGVQELLALSEPWPSAQLGSIASLAPQIRTWPAPRTRQFLGSFSRQTGCFQEAISCRGRFFPKELKWGASWCRLFTGNHCESSFATHQEGLSLSRLHPALCPQPSFPGHAQGVTSVPLTHLPQAAAGMLTWGRGSSQMVKIWTGCRQCRASQGRSCMASPVPHVSLWWEKVWEKVRGHRRLHQTLAHQLLHSPSSLCC